MNVRTLCLGILTLHDATGYEIKKLVEDGAFSHFLEASFGSIYPALTKLTDEGLVTCEAHVQDGRPDKKVYSITRKGRRAFARSLNEAVAPDKFKSEFLFHMVFAHLMDRDVVSGLIDERIAEMKTELEEMQVDPDIAGTPGGEFVLRYGEAVYEASLKFLEENRGLAEEAARLPELEDALGSGRR